MKKILSSVLTVLLCSALLATGTSMAKGSDVDVEKFRGLGFTDEEIQELTPKEIKMYEGVEGELVSDVTEYYQISKTKDGKAKAEKVSKSKALEKAKEKNNKLGKLNKKIIELKKSKEGKKQTEVTQIDNEIMALATDWENTRETDDWIELTGKVSKLTTGDYQFKNNYQWLTDPAILLNDVVGISHSESWQILDGYEYSRNAMGIYYSGYKDQYGGCYCTDYVESSVEFNYDIKVGVNGVASEFKLNNGNPKPGQYYNYTNFRGYVVERVRKASSSMTNSNMFGGYAHQEITGDISVDIFPANISVTPGYKVSEATPVNVPFPVK